MKTLHIFGVIGICVILFSTSHPLFAANPEDDCECRIPKPSTEKEEKHPHLTSSAPFFADIPSIGTTTRVDLGIKSTKGSHTYVFIEDTMLEKSSQGTQPKIGIGFTFPLKYIKTAAKKVANGTQKVVGYVQNAGRGVIKIVKYCWFW